MVGWHNEVGSASRTSWWDDGANVISFSRGHRGWVALNNGTAAKTVTVPTGLPAGRYCDVIGGGRTGRGCAGDTVVVKGHGLTTVTVPAKGALAVLRSSRL
jgi:alpha-amylase